MVSPWSESSSILAVRSVPWPMFDHVYMTTKWQGASSWIVSDSIGLAATGVTAIASRPAAATAVRIPFRGDMFVLHSLRLGWCAQRRVGGSSGQPHAVGFAV